MSKYIDTTDQLIASLGTHDDGEDNAPTSTVPRAVKARLRKLFPTLTAEEIATLAEVSTLDGDSVAIQTPHGGKAGPVKWAVDQVLDRARERRKHRTAVEAADDAEVGTIAPPPAYSPTRR